MKIVLAPNAFKESLTAAEAARAMRRGLARALPGAELVEFPVADGGDGTAEVLRLALGGRWTRHRVAGPHGRPVEARLLQLGGSGPRTYVVEVAETSGLRLVPPASAIRAGRRRAASAN
jgi:glycerate 2-kinase